MQASGDLLVASGQPQHAGGDDERAQHQSQAPLERLLLDLCVEASFPIVLDPAVHDRLEEEGRISIKIEDLKLRDALDILTALQQLSWKYSCGIVVVTAEEFLERFPDEPIGAPEGADESIQELYSMLSVYRMPVFDMEEVPFSEVVEFFAMNYNLEIVVGRLVHEIPPARRKVSLQMQDVTVAEALTLTTGLVGATWNVKSGAISIDKAPNLLAGPGECPF